MIPTLETALIMTAPLIVMIREYDSSTAPARGLRTLGGSVEFCWMVTLLMVPYETLEGGSKIELRGWNFQGTKLSFDSSSWVRAMAAWTML